MAISSLPTSTFFFVVLLTLFLQGALSTTNFTLRNHCPVTIWPATVAGGGVSQLASTGLELASGASVTLVAPTKWQGRIWPRTSCATDSRGKFSCATGDCASGEVECKGAGGIPPSTLIEFTLNGYQGKDFFDVSLVDGFNLPVSIAPDGVSGCSSSLCSTDINRICPEKLQVVGSDGKVVACKSSCLAYDTDEACCRGAYNDPTKCKPSADALRFKQACPHAYSYAYDDASSTFTCTGANYLITFCP